MKYFGEFLRFSRSERRGIITLVIIIILLLILDILLDDLVHQKEKNNFSEFKKEIIAFKKSLKKKEESFSYSNTSGKNTEEELIELFEFDPNKATRAELNKLGLSDKQINTIKKYLTKGGKFYKKEDLKKIYGIGESTYNRLKDYIIITEKQDSKQIVSKKDTLNNHSVDIFENLKINLNDADTSKLVLLDGIGEVYAQRICKYRELLGGYVNADQLKEVYGLPENTVVNIQGKLRIDSASVIKININRAEFKELIRHPYIDKYQTQAILKYRKIKGNISEIKELYKNNIFTLEELKKLQPYLSCKE